MKAIIVAGGKGERLRPLTNTIPKPMVDVNGKPILQHIVYLLKSHGITEFIFALCYLPHVITDYFGNGKKFGISIEYTFESEDKPMGTAGAIIPAKPYINGTFIVTYADILRKLDITDMIKFHKKTKSFATLHVYKRKGPNPKSMVQFDSNNRITQFIERPKSKDISEDFVWSNGSFYILDKQIFDYIPPDKPSDFGKDIFPKLLAADKSLYGYPTNGYFVDVGNLQNLKRANETHVQR